ncbi:hypothetical protein FB451DRAFT_1519086 [Mycena latifolia]|nr:hypothetical protein FB451DRAFT_1519086 [Mycena latifolia]
MDFSNRGRCLKGDCRSGCTVFIPKSGPAPNHPGLAQCAVCADGCFAAQHESPTQPPKPQPPPPAGPTPSATASTMHGSRGFAAPPPSQGLATGSPFHTHVQNRQEGIEAKLRNETAAPAFNGSKKFHPAEKLEGDLNPNDSKGKKRKRKKKASDSEPDWAPKRGPGAKGRTPPTKMYTVVLAEDTKAVARRKYGKPTAAKLMQMNRHGYVQTVHLHKNNTPEEITNELKTAFHGVSEMAIYGFRVLEVESRTSRTAKGKPSRKQSFWVKPIKGKLGMDTWERARAMATVRDAGSGYKNTIFIALDPAAPNLRFPGLDLTADKPDHDIETGDESDSSDASGNGDMETGDVGSMDGGAEKQRSGPGSQMDAEGAGDNHPEGIKDQDSDVEVTLDDDEKKSFQSFDSPDTWTFVRALKNISKPDSPNQSRWWRNAPLAHLQEFNLIVPLLADLIDSTVTGQLHVDSFFTKIDKYVVKRLESMASLAIQIDIARDDEKSRDALGTEFSDLFGVGPGGVSVVLPGLSLLYEGLERIRDRGFEMNRESLKTEYLLHESSKALLTCLTHFRLTSDRSLWDPKGGFRELAQILSKHDDHLPIGDATNSMHHHFNAMDLRLDPISSLQESLEDALGSATDPGHMMHAVVVGGEFGLRRFYTVIVEPLLDTVDRSDYDDVFKLFNDCSRALARKVANYIKTKPGHGTKHKSADVPTDEDTLVRVPTHATSELPNRSLIRAPAREHKLRLPPDVIQNMTGTESAAENWYKNLKPGPGIKTRRKRRHTTEYVPSSDSEDYAPPRPKPTPKPKPAWVDVDTPPHSPPAPPAPKSMGHKKDLEDAEALLNMGWYQLRRRILSRFPHPDAKQRDSLVGLNSLSDSAQYKRISVVYHPDRNVTQSPEWQEISAKIAAAVNGKRR